MRAMSPDDYGRFIGRCSVYLWPGYDGEEWYLRDGLTYVSRKHGPGKGVRITCKQEMPTDGASIPRFFWRFIGCPIRSRFAPAAVIHDGICRTKHLSRELGDELFKEMLEILGCPAWKISLMYTAVRAGATSDEIRKFDRQGLGDPNQVVVHHPEG